MYKAIIAPITVRPHPNADRLQLGTVLGNQVVVGLEVKDGQVGVYFPSDGQLSHEHCVKNGLYNESACRELGVEPLYGHDNQPKFGYFGKSRRVRSQRFRGEKSDGLWLELDTLQWTSYDLAQLKAGDTFAELSGHEVCGKYYTPATLRAMKNAATHGKKAPDVVFPKHVDTEQFQYYAERIPAGSLITISEKLHGTSGRYGHVLETVPLNRWKSTVVRLAAGACRVATGLPWKANPTRWTHLNGSRNVTLEQSAGEGYYGTNEFRYELTKDLRLHKGEILYFEIVGYVTQDMPIMAPQAVDKKAYKDVVARYGETMTYTYGCVSGQHKLYVYRITRLNEDGIETELPWPVVKQRCRELGLEAVPEFCSFIYDGNVASLRGLAERVVEGASTLDDRHIREGVVLRVETPDGQTQFYKHKSFLFRVFEGLVKDSDTVVDTEEAA